MSLNHLNHQLHIWTRTLMGRFGVLLLLAALIPGARLAVEHAHADGDQAHRHVTNLTPSQVAASEVSPAGEEQLHQHDIGTAVSEFPPPILLHTVSLTPERLGNGLSASPAPSSPRSPPRRPPIA